MNAPLFNRDVQTVPGWLRVFAFFHLNLAFSSIEEEQHATVVKNCYVPLSVAYINSEGAIEEIHPLQVQDTNNVVSTATNIRFALETPQGWFDQHHITPGMVIRTERGTLLQTFQKQ